MGLNGAAHRSRTDDLFITSECSCYSITFYLVLIRSITNGYKNIRNGKRTAKNVDKP